jgi:hypothetical protein
MRIILAILYGLRSNCRGSILQRRRAGGAPLTLAHFHQNTSWPAAIGSWRPVARQGKRTAFCLARPCCELVVRQLQLPACMLESAQRSVPAKRLNPPPGHRNKKSRTNQANVNINSNPPAPTGNLPTLTGKKLLVAKLPSPQLPAPLRRPFLATSTFRLQPVPVWPAGLKKSYPTCRL